jgi:hypothetical protein
VLKERLGADRHEGLDDDGQTRFFHELVRDLFEYDRVTNAELRRYDLNIVAHWKAITEKRNVADGRGADDEVLPVPQPAVQRDLPRLVF